MITDATGQMRRHRRWWRWFQVRVCGNLWIPCPDSAGFGLNNLQQCIPIATPDTTTFGATNDFYRIGVRDYRASCIAICR